MPAKATELQTLLGIRPHVSDNSIQRNIVRFAQKQICTTHFIRYAHRNGHLTRRAKSCKRAIVVPATIPKPIPINIKPNTGHEQNIRHDDEPRSGLMNPMGANLHGHIRRPHMKLQRPVARTNNRQTRPPGGIRSQPPGDNRPHVELPRQRPVKPYTRRRKNR